MKTDLEKCESLLKSLGIIYVLIDYEKEDAYNSANKEIRLDDDSEKLEFNGYCSADIEFDGNGKFIKINIWGD